MEVANGLAQAPPLALRRIKANLNDADRLMNFSTAQMAKQKGMPVQGFTLMLPKLAKHFYSSESQFSKE